MQTSNDSLFKSKGIKGGQSFFIYLGQFNRMARKTMFYSKAGVIYN